MELKNLIATSATVDVYKEGNMAIKVFKEGCPKTMALYEALTHSRVEATGLRVPRYSRGFRHRQPLGHPHGLHRGAKPWLRS